MSRAKRMKSKHRQHRAAYKALVRRIQAGEVTQLRWAVLGATVAAKVTGDMIYIHDGKTERVIPYAGLGEFAPIEPTVALFGGRYTP